MSYPQPPSSPDLAVPFARALPSRRPTSALVVGICGIAWAGLALVGFVFGALMYIVPAPQPNAVLDSMRRNHALMAFTFINSAVGLILAIMLLSASIGLIRLRPWARKAMITWAIAAAVVGVVNLIVAWIWTQPIIEQAQRQLKTPEAALMLGRIMGACSGIVFGVAAPLIVIYLMTRPAMKAAYAADVPSPGTPGEGGQIPSLGTPGEG